MKKGFDDIMFGFNLEEHPEIEYICGTFVFGDIGKKIKRKSRGLDLVDQDIDSRWSVDYDGDNDKMFDKIIYNGDATVFVKDGEKIVLKKNKDEKYDASYAFLYAYFLLNSGMSKNQASKFIDSVVPAEVDEDEIASIIEDTSLSLDEYVEKLRKACLK